MSGRVRYICPVCMGSGDEIVSSHKQERIHELVKKIVLSKDGPINMEEIVSTAREGIDEILGSEDAGNEYLVRFHIMLGLVLLERSGLVNPLGWERKAE